jgi:preprotein translocase subunit SecG
MFLGRTRLQLGRAEPTNTGTLAWRGHCVCHLRRAHRTITDLMVILMTVVHIAVCLFLIIVVLLQSGKSGDIAAAFGGMGSQTAFGPRGTATILSKATTWSAVIFMVTSITLSVYASRRGTSRSVLQGVKASPASSQPAKPAAPPTTPPAQVPQN